MTMRKPTRGERPDPTTRKPRLRLDRSGTAAVSWAQLTEILGPPPHGKPGTSERPAGGVYGESNPGSRAAARRDAEVFAQVLGRSPTPEEMAMIEARHLGWNYQ
jgi:hypothetical protein